MSRYPWQSSGDSQGGSPAMAIALILVVVAFCGGYFVGHHGVTLPGAAASVGADDVSVHFSPKGGCTDKVVSEIGAAHQSIKVMAYSFTSKEIASALIAAQHRGAKVTIIADEKELKEFSRAGECAHAGIAVHVDGQHPIAHNKVMLIDGRTIITGSFNFTEQAEHSNAENLLVLHDVPKLYQQYDNNFQLHLGHSQPFNESFVKADRRGKSHSDRE